jgi:hypothetical protein
MYIRFNLYSILNIFSAGHIRRIGYLASTEMIFFHPSEANDDYHHRGLRTSSKVNFKNINSCYTYIMIGFRIVLQVFVLSFAKY